MPKLSERIFPQGAVPGHKPVEAPTPPHTPPTLPPSRQHAPASGFQRSPVPPIGWSQPNVSRWEKGGAVPQHRAYVPAPAIQSFPGNGAQITVTAPTPPPSATVGIHVSPATVASGGTVTVTVAATNANAVTLTCSNANFGPYSLPAIGGPQPVTLTGVAPNSTVTFTATANPAKKGGKSASASTSVAIT